MKWEDYTMFSGCCQVGDNRPNSWDSYGGRGIKVCDRWKDFRNFLADMGEPPPGMQLDRSNNDGNYELSNCRWATPKENCQNRRSNRNITYLGETKCISEWARQVGLDRRMLRNRIASGWPLDKALYCPPMANGEWHSVLRERRRCEIDGCSSPHYGRGLCSKHWQQQRLRSLASVAG